MDVSPSMVDRMFARTHGMVILMMFMVLPWPMIINITVIYVMLEFDSFVAAQSHYAGGGEYENNHNHVCQPWWLRFRVLLRSSIQFSSSLHRRALTGAEILTVLQGAGVQEWILLFCLLRTQTGG